MVLAEQVTTIGKPAFKNYVGKVSEAKTREIECAVKVHLGLWKDNQR
jgi:mRNA-degrading endonuclease toxin of MazEF toxin-antitoxin module